MHGKPILVHTWHTRVYGISGCYGCHVSKNCLCMAYGPCHRCANMAFLVTLVEKNVLVKARHVRTHASFPRGLQVDRPPAWRIAHWQGKSPLKSNADRRNPHMKFLQFGCRIASKGRIALRICGPPWEMSGNCHSRRAMASGPGCFNRHGPPCGGASCARHLALPSPWRLAARRWLLEFHVNTTKAFHLGLYIFFRNEKAF